MTDKNHRRNMRRLKLRRQRSKDSDYALVEIFKGCCVYRKTEEAKQREREKRTYKGAKREYED